MDKYDTEELTAEEKPAGGGETVEESISPAFSEDDEAIDIERGYDNDSKSGKKKKRIRRIAVLAGIVILTAAVLIIFKAVKSNNSAKDMYTDTAVTRRTISNTITGSSSIVPNDSYNVMTIKSGDITADYFKEGDTVKKGDKLYQFDDDDARKNLQTSQNALTKAEQAYSDAQKTINNLSIKAGSGGKVKEVLVKEGEMVQSGGKIAVLYNDSTMKIKIPFNENDAANIRTGERAAVTVSGTGNEIDGVVALVSGASVALESHSTVRYVTINVTNPGALTTSDKATAQIGEYACADAGQFEYISETSVNAEASGKIEKLYIEENDRVYSGQTVASLDSDSANSTLKNAKLGLDDAKLALEKANDAIDDYLVEAPIEGTVVTKNAKSGDTIDSSNGSEALCVIYDLSSVKLSIDVDETEIALVKQGQSVKVTADAVEGEFEGEITKVPVDGVNENGVTTYTVEVRIDNYGSLLPGMNVDAEITVEEAQDVIAVPVNSVNRGNIVFVRDDGQKRDNDVTDMIANKDSGYEDAENNDKDSGKDSGAGEGAAENAQRSDGAGTAPDGGEQPPQGESVGLSKENGSSEKLDISLVPSNLEIPEGYRAILVETGINDTEYIEIKSGLTENDTVRTLNTKSSSADAALSPEEQMMQNMQGMSRSMGGGMGGMSGGMGGGMSGGGSRSGGAPGGR